MEITVKSLYEKIMEISQKVKHDLKVKGIVAPSLNENGSVQIGRYTIHKQHDGLYSINDKRGEIVIGGINLPQTAVVVANDLALGKSLNTQLIQIDKDYGYAIFDETIHMKAAQKSKNRNWDMFELMTTKYMMARAKKEYCKSTIVSGFEKLRKIA